MSPNFDPNLMKKTSEDAAIRFAPIYYGKLDLAYSFRVYRQPYNADAPAVVPEEVTEQEFQAYPAPQQLLELVISVDGSSFNPTQPFVYERKVRVGGRPRNNKDWFATFVPSANAVLGSLDKLVPGLWVAIEDVTSARDPQYNAPKMKAVYKDEAGCAAAFMKGKTDQPIPQDVVTLASALRAASVSEADFTELVNADAQLKRFGANRLWKATEPKT